MWAKSLLPDAFVNRKMNKMPTSKGMEGEEEREGEVRPSSENTVKYGKIRSEL